MNFMDNETQIKGVIPLSINSVDKIIINMVGFYFVLNPFYLWKSGLPQLADFLLITTLLLYVIRNNFSIYVSKKSKRIIFSSLCFIAWIILVNFTWMINLNSEEFITNTLFYIYNIIVMIVFISMFTLYKAELLYVIQKSIIVSMVFQLVQIIATGGYNGGRITGSFNNPNQLGYYALFMAGFLMFLNDKIHISSRKLFLSILLSFVLTLASFSNGAILAFIIMFAFFLFSKSTNKKTKRKIIIFVVILGAVTGYIYNNTSFIQENVFYSSLEERLSRTYDKIENASEGRGYNRIIEYPEYWFLGSGEGENSRFDSHLEFHSTIGNIQVSYGIIGTVLFSTMLINSLKINGFYMWYVLLGILLYGFSHNGIRNTLLWIFLASLIGIGQQKYTDGKYK